MKQDLMHKDVHDVNITPEERRNIWQLWRQNLKDWVWYTQENPDWLDLDIQTAVKRHIIAPLRSARQRLRGLAQQKKRREFPESESRLAQLLLFAWGSLPRIGAGLREQFAVRRKHSIRRSGSIRALWERMRLHPAIFLGTCVSAAAVIVLLSMYTVGTTVRYDGINLGTVSSRRTVNLAVEQLQTVTRQTLGDESYTIDRSLLSTQSHVVPRREVESREDLTGSLTAQIGDVTYGYTLYVDGEAVAATTFPGAIEQLMEQMKVGYITESTVDCYFVEDVEVKEGYVDSSLISNLGYIAEKLNATKAGAVVYTVKPGDVWSAIAEQNGMTNQELLNLNPGYDIAVLHAGELVQPLPAACTGCGDRLAGEALARFGYGRLDVQEFLSPVGGLHHEGAAHHLPGHGHMLVSGQQDVEIQLLTDAVGDVFAGRGEHAPRGEVALEAAVVNADRQVDLIAQPFQRGGHGGDRVGDRNAGEVLRLFPDVHIVGHDADDADPQPVLQRVDARGKAHPRLVPADVFAHTARFQHVEVAVKVRHPVVEVVVAQRHIVIAAAVHHLGEPAGVTQCVMAVGTQRRALQDIAAVDDQRVPVLMKLAGTLEQTDIPLLPAAVVGGIDITMEVRGEVDGKAFCVHRLTPVPA